MDSELFNKVIQDVANAGAASGYAQALDDVANNLERQAEEWRSTRPGDEYAKFISNELDSAVEEVRAEHSRRTEAASVAYQQATASQQMLAASMVGPFRMRLAKLLGGAAQRLARP